MKRLFLMIALVLSLVAYSSAMPPSPPSKSYLSDAELTALAGLTSAANAIPYFTGSGTAGTISSSANMVSLLGSADYATARTNLGLAIGSNVQAYDADLTTYAGITPSADVQSLLGCATEAAMRTFLDLESGTDFNAYDADLTTYAGITPSVDVQTMLGSANDAAILSNIGAEPALTDEASLYSTLSDVSLFLEDLVDDTTPQLGGDLDYNEKNQVFNITLTSDDTASGDIITVIYGESVVLGQLCYPDSTDNEWKLALGTNVAVKHPAMGIALETKSDGQSGKMLLRGTIRDATYFSGVAMGDIIYLSDTSAGNYVTTAPSGTGDIVQIVGFAIAANYIFFNPDYTYVEVP